MSRIDFHVFGGEEVASSRLRAWRLGEALGRLGHEVRFDVDDHAGSDLVVFQKVRPRRSMQSARAAGAVTVFDFDDNYLDPSVGVRAEFVEFMNLSDVVTVGSADLASEATRYHRRVWLFDNPLDLAPDGPSKTDYRGAVVGWFGHPSNLASLRGLHLNRQVTTLTRGGDIPWHPEAVDDDLIGFDLVLIPVALDSWTGSKNANRALKCIGLGVPVLATSTPEHRRAFEGVGLDDRFLVEAGGDWDEAIDALMDDDEVPELMRRARSAAWEQHGIDVVARRWYESVSARAARPPAAGPEIRTEDQPRVVVFEDAPGFSAEPTLRSLRALGFADEALAVVSRSSRGTVSPEFEAIPHTAVGADFFDVYEAVSTTADGAARSGSPLMLVRAGSRILPALTQLVEKASDEAVTVLSAQYDSARDSAIPDLVPPSAVLAQPTVLHGILIPDRVWSDVGGLDPIMLHWGLWDYLVATLDRGKEVEITEVPALLVPDAFASLRAIALYAEHLRSVDPSLAGDLPSIDNENDRLERILFAIAVDNHRDIFERNMVSVFGELRAGSKPPASGAPPLLRKARRRLRREPRSLHADTETPPSPELIRHPDGRVFVLSGEEKRHVTSALLADAMREAWGEYTDCSEADPLLQLPDGEPVRLYWSGDLPFVIVNGWRYEMRGIPLPEIVSAADVADFPVAEPTLDAARAHAPRASLRAARAESESLRADRDRASAIQDRRSVRWALSAANVAGRTRRRARFWR